MVACWEPGTQYDYGAVVEYEGAEYKIIQPHRSQSDWAPPLTPALWGRVNDDCDPHQQQQQQYQPQYQPPQQQQWGNDNKGSGYDQPPPPPQDGYQSGDVHISHDEQKKNWWDLDDKRKQELEVGGGLLAGAAVLGGGLFALKQHNKSSEEKKAVVWAAQNWEHDAEERTAYIRQHGLRQPVAWILTEGQDIPHNAIQGGEENGSPLFICRAFHDGGLQIGKASSVFKKGAVIGYKHDEIHLSKYEILVGDERAIRWVDASGRLNVSSLRANPVEGGRENNGTLLYVIKAPYHGATHPGKASEQLDGAYITYGGKEKRSMNTASFAMLEIIAGFVEEDSRYVSKATRTRAHASF